MSPLDETAVRTRISRLPLMMLIGLVAGGGLGWFAPEARTWLKPLSLLFVRPMEMLLAPLLLVSWSAKVAAGGVKKYVKDIGRLTVISALWIAVFSILALFVGSIAGRVAHPLDEDNKVSLNCTCDTRDCILPQRTSRELGYMPDLGPISNQAATSTLQNTCQQGNEFLVNLANLVPSSIFDPMIQNSILYIMILSVLLGIALRAVSDKTDAGWSNDFSRIAQVGTDALYKLIDYVMLAAPIGVGVASAAAWAATAHSFGGVTSVIWPLIKYAVGLCVALFIFLALLTAIMIVVLRVHKKKRPGGLQIEEKFVAAICEPAMLALATATSKAVLPRTMQALTQLGVPPHIVNFVTPIGFRFNLAGSTLYLPFTVMAVMNYVVGSGEILSPLVHFNLLMRLTRPSKSIVGTPGVAFCVLAEFLSHTDLQIFNGKAEAITAALGALACIDIAMDRCRTFVNVVGNCIMTVLVYLVWSLLYEHRKSRSDGQ